MTRNDVAKVALWVAVSIGVLGCGDDDVAARDSGMDAAQVDAAGDAMLDAEPDAHVLPDAAIEDLPCDVLEQRWWAFVNANNTCTRDEDCAVFERLFDHQVVCENPRGLQVSIHPAAIADAERFAARVSSTECLAEATWSHVGYDGIYYDTPVCGALGRCTADGFVCGSNLDGGY